MGSCLLIHSSLALALEEELDTYLLPSLELLHADSIMTITCPLHRVFCFSGQHKTLISQTECPRLPVSTTLFPTWASLPYAAHHPR